jgi:hypothetical protein
MDLLPPNSKAQSALRGCTKGQQQPFQGHFEDRASTDFWSVEEPPTELITDLRNS